MRKCNHVEADKIKPGSQQTVAFDCKVCKKIIVKGRKPSRKNGCFGKPGRKKKVGII